MKIVIGTTSFECPAQADPPVSQMTGERDWKTITVIGTASDAKAAFVDGAAISQQWDSIRYLTAEEVTAYKAAGTAYSTDASGNAYVTETQSTDLSEYCVAGEVVDTRDGNVTVFMGKKTDAEVYQATIDALVLASL